MANEHEDEDDNTLENDFLSGDLMPNDFDDDDAILGAGGSDDDLPFGANADDDDNELDPNDEEEGDGDEEDEENEDPQGKSNKATPDSDPTDNEFYLRAKYWQEEGIVSPTVEIKKDMTHLELEDLYLEHIKENAMNRVQTEIKGLLEAKGIDPDTIFGAESDDAFYQKQYARIAGISYDALVEGNEDVTEALRILGTEYWIAKSNGTLTAEDVAANVEKDLDKNDEEDLYDKYQGYFGKEAKRLSGKIQADTQASAKARIEKAKADSAYIKQKLASSGRSPAEIEKVLNALYKEDQVYDNGKGERKRVTLFEKKRLEGKSSLDLQIEMATSLILGDNTATIKEKSERVGSLNALQQLARATSQGSSKGNSKSGYNNRTTTKSQEFEDMLLDKT